MTGPLSAATISASESRDRRKVVEEHLRALGPVQPARRMPPPEGRLGADEQPTAQLRATLVALGPVFADFGRYLATRVDLVPRRVSLELGAIEDRELRAPDIDPEAHVAREIGGIARRFSAFDPVPRMTTLWTGEHLASLAPGVRVVVTIVRPDADALQQRDLPHLHLLAPWFGVARAAFRAAVDDFSQALQRRLDQTWQALAFMKLAEDERAGGALGAPVCYRDYCASRVLTLEHLEGVSLADALAAGSQWGLAGPVDRSAVARQVASGWLRQAIGGFIVPFAFDLRHFVIQEGRLALTGGAFEPQTTAGQARFLGYLVAASADDTDTAAGWIISAASQGENGQPEDVLLRRLRQVVPFRDGEWSGDDRLSDQLLAQWRGTTEAGWQMLAHQLHLYRGIQAVAVITARLEPRQDPLLAALKTERLRLGLADAAHLVDPRGLLGAMDKVLRDVVNLPQQLDQILTLAADGRLRVKLHVPDAREHRQVRNRTASLVASLVILTGLTFVLRHVAPAWGPAAERLGFLLLMIVGGWLLVAAARL